MARPLIVAAHAPARFREVQKLMLFVMLIMLVRSTAHTSASDPKLIGQWKAVTYRINGIDHPMEGLAIFTAHYFSANVLFHLTNGSVDDANANAGPYQADGTRIVFTQWVQIHLRPEDRRDPIFLKKGADETATYHFNGPRLIITFPSGSQYVLDRIQD